MSDDWLDISPVKLPAIVNDESKYHGMIEALKQCSPKQRLYLNALQDACFDEDVARKALAEKGTRVSRHAIRKWEAEPYFMRALSDAVEYTLAAAGVSQVGIVAQLQRAVRVNGQTIKCKTEDGQEYERFVDATNLTTALDRLAKRLGMLKSDDAEARRGNVPTGPGLSITFIHTAGSPQTVRVGEVVDAEVIKLPTPSGSKS
jgi:hypothetical protein